MGSTYQYGVQYRTFIGGEFDKTVWFNSEEEAKEEYLSSSHPRGQFRDRGDGKGLNVRLIRRVLGPVEVVPTQEVPSRENLPWYHPRAMPRFAGNAHHCVSARCHSTGWGGSKRVHDRDPRECPEFALARDEETNDCPCHAS